MSRYGFGESKRHRIPDPDPRNTGTDYCCHVLQSTWHYGLPKTGGLRAAFLSESVMDLHQRLAAHGSGLATSTAEPRQLLTSLIRH